MIHPSLRRTPETAPVKDSAALPWGVVLVPLAPARHAHSPDPMNLDPASADEVPRCTDCFGYINAYCMFERRGWICSLCGQRNDLPERYSQSSNRANLEEMQRGIVDILEDCVEVDDIYSSELKPEERPACVAVIDVSGSEEFVEVARSGVLALLEALPAAMLFGLVTVGRKSIGVYDMRSPFPHCYTLAVPADGEMEVSLAEVLPVDCMLVQLGEHKDNIAAAVESLAPAVQADEMQVDGGAAAQRHFAFGSCLDAVLEERNCALRIISVIGSRPTWGLGALAAPEPAAGDGGGADAQRLPEGAEDYEQLAARAAALAASVDLFVVAEQGYVGVEALRPLVSATGGTLIYYSGLDTSALPQDLFRIFSRPIASRALLRLRCSAGFQVARAYGHLTADEQYVNLYHISSCHSESCFAADLEFDNPSGVMTNLDVQPTMQLAFAYSCIVPVPDSSAYQVQRRLRIETVRADVGRLAQDLFASADVDVVVTLLAHKIIRALAVEGLHEARMLLQDWLVMLAARYNEHLMRRREMQLDVTFAKFASLGPLPRIVFGMLRGRLLDPVAASRDDRAFAAHLCTSLAPDALSLLFYPRLSVFPDVKTRAPEETGLALSQTSIAKRDSAVFVLDAYTDMVVFYTKGAAATNPFPPPPDCALRRYLQETKDERAVCPHVAHCSDADQTAHDFLARLFEDDSSGGLGGPADVRGGWATAGAGGYGRFIEILRTEVAELLE